MTCKSNCDIIALKFQEQINYKMIFDPSSLLTEEEIIIPRTPMELAKWVENKCRSFARNDDAKKWVLFHERLSKKFHEEIYPLSLLVTHIYSCRSDVHCIPTMDDKKDFDAIIIDYSISPPSKLNVEITSAADDYEQHLRMEYFLKHGHVNVYGSLSYSGTERAGHEIRIGNEMINHTELLQRTFSLIKDRAEKNLRNWVNLRSMVKDTCWLWCSTTGSGLIATVIGWHSGSLLKRRS